MKKICCVLLVLLLLCWASGTALSASAVDLSELTRAELDALSGEIAAEIALHHEVGADEQNAALSLTKAGINEACSARGLTVSWPWFDYTYEKAWDRITLTTRVDCRDADRQKTRHDVRAELFPEAGELAVFYLALGDMPVIDRRAELPASPLSPGSPHRISARTGADLTAMSRVELDALQAAVRSEVTAQHTPVSATEEQVHRLVSEAVERHCAAQGAVKFSWPWFDYDYTCDWGCYTETTRISWQTEDGSRQEQSVYAEVFPEDGGLVLACLVIGDEVICDSRDTLRSDASLLFLRSRDYPAAKALADAGEYERAMAMWSAMGDYYDSAQQAAACQKILDSRKYAAAAALMEKGRFEEAISAFEALNGYSDSEQQIALCQEEIHRRIYADAMACMADGRYEEAAALLGPISRFEDSEIQLQACRAAIQARDYDAARTLLADRRYEQALAAFAALGSYADSPEQAAECQRALEAIDRTIALTETELLLYPGKHHRLQPQATPLTDTAPKKTSFVFSCEDPAVAKVSRDGTVTAQKPGVTFVTCAAADTPYVAVRIPVRVAAPVSKVTLSESRLELGLSAVDASLGTHALTASVSPDDAYVRTVQWTSSNPRAAVVDAHGVVQAVGPGETTITATSDDPSRQKAVCRVKVTLAVESVSFTIPDGTVFVGKSMTLKATVLPKNAAVQTLTWTSSDPTIATVSSKGVVKGVSPGRVTISAASASGVVCKATATVKFAPTTMTITAKARCIAKNHVGNSWSYSFEVNDAAFSSGRSIQVELGDAIRLSCQITEHDKRPDNGWCSETVEVTEEVLRQGTKITKTVYVRENGGRYSGNQAEWQVTFTLTPKR